MINTRSILTKVCRKCLLGVAMSSAALLAGCEGSGSAVMTDETPATLPAASVREPSQLSPADRAPRAPSQSPAVVAHFAPVERSEILDPSVSRNPVEVGELLDVDEVPWEMATETEIIEIGEPLEADPSPGGLIDEMAAELVEIGEPLDAEDPLGWSESDSVPTDIGRWMDADAPMTGDIPDSEPIEIGPPLEVTGSPPSF